MKYTFWGLAWAVLWRLALVLTMVVAVFLVNPWESIDSAIAISIVISMCVILLVYAGRRP